MIRSIVTSLRCALVAMLAVAMVSSRPAMLAAHAMPGMHHGCGMTMPSHHSTGTDHGCSTTTDGPCCDDCMGACAIGSDVRKPLVVLVATYTHVVTVIEHPPELVRTRRQLALRLPPQLGPPQVDRS